ncbi:RNA-binding S4 domain-containing protein [Mycoplasmoides alvi]|uniref:RNA-binding S4 domain-containing protein n=1 Tax=Mycoplasmoides alvi TaxID=78580 RepID=UPI000B01B569|nr:RNA-binding S4 domain-containing protein [Mycoplasmoides alvi]
MEKLKPIVIKIKTSYIELGKFLKFANIISTGGCSKSYLQIHDVFVNNSLEKRRGKKLYNGDEIIVGNKVYLLVN